MMEFLIRRVDGDWFSLPAGRWAEIVRPTSFASRTLASENAHCIEVLGCEISFSDEDPGILVAFESGNIPSEIAEQIVNEICQNIVKATGQEGKVVLL